MMVDWFSSDDGQAESNVCEREEEMYTGMFTRAV